MKKCTVKVWNRKIVGTKKKKSDLENSENDNSVVVVSGKYT